MCARTNSPFLSVIVRVTSRSPRRRITATPAGEPFSTRTLPLMAPVVLSCAVPANERKSNRATAEINLVAFILFSFESKAITKNSVTQRPPSQRRNFEDQDSAPRCPTRIISSAYVSSSHHFENERGARLRYYHDRLVAGSRLRPGRSHEEGTSTQSSAD